MKTVDIHFQTSYFHKSLLLLSFESSNQSLVDVTFTQYIDIQNLHQNEHFDKKRYCSLITILKKISEHNIFTLSFHPCTKLIKNSHNAFTCQQSCSISTIILVPSLIFTFFTESVTLFQSSSITISHPQTSSNYSTISTNHTSSQSNLTNLNSCRFFKYSPF